MLKQINFGSGLKCSQWSTSGPWPYTANFARVGTDLQQSVKTCCQQADIWMRSLALCLSVLTGLQRPVNRSVTSCCDRAAAMLFSTGLSRVVVTELQQCCFQQGCRKLLTQSCSNAVFNNLRQTCCKPRKALYDQLRVSTILNKKRPNRLPQFGCSVSLNNKTFI